VVKKKMQKSHFFVSGKQNYFPGSFKVMACKRIASATLRRSTGTPPNHHPPMNSTAETAQTRGLSNAF
jgi:hypothetical protein